MADISITVKSYVPQVLSEIESRTKTALDECGLVATGHAQEYVPRDTGNLAGSITHETEEEQVIIGTNVDYAPYVEFDEKAQHASPTGAHYLKKSLSEHIDEYEKIFARELKS